MYFKNAVDVNILLDSRGVNIEDINKLVSAGIRSVGFGSLMEFAEAENLLLPVKKHYLGSLDELNMPEVIEKFDLIENVDSINVARRLNDFCVRKGVVKKVLLKVNVLNQETHYGFLPGEIFDAFLEISKLGGLKPTGISAYIPNYGNRDKEKQVLRKARTVFDLLNNKYRGIDVLSLNAIQNWEDVIAEKTNEIRVGKAVIGE